MKKILLACNAGMSTSMLVRQMRAAAKELGIEADINAVSLTEANDLIARWMSSSSGRRSNSRRLQWKRLRPAAHRLV